MPGHGEEGVQAKRPCGVSDVIAAAPAALVHGKRPIVWIPVHTSKRHAALSCLLCTAQGQPSRYAQAETATTCIC